MDARGVLQLINNLLTTQGATCSVDAALWRITAVLPPEQTDAAGGTSTSAAAPAGASAARAAAGGKAGAGATGAAAAGKGGAVTPRTAADLADVAEAALFAELSRGGDGPTSGNTMMQVSAAFIDATSHAHCKARTRMQLGVPAVCTTVCTVCLLCALLCAVCCVLSYMGQPHAS